MEKQLRNSAKCICHIVMKIFILTFIIFSTGCFEETREPVSESEANEIEAFISSFYDFLNTYTETELESVTQWYFNEVSSAGLASGSPSPMLPDPFGGKGDRNKSQKEGTPDSTKVEYKDGQITRITQFDKSGNLIREIRPGKPGTQIHGQTGATTKTPTSNTDPRGTTHQGSKVTGSSQAEVDLLNNAQKLLDALP